MSQLLVTEVTYVTKVTESVAKMDHNCIKTKGLFIYEAQKIHGLLPSPSLCDFLVIRSRSLKKGILALLRVVSINDTERQELHINFVSLYNFYFQLTVSCLLFRIIRKEEASIDNILQFSWQCF